MKKVRIVEQGGGKKIEMRPCPKCKDKVMIKLKSGGVEMFECENCKLKIIDKN